MASFSSERESLLRGTTSEGRYRTTARESGDDAGESDDARGDYYSDDSHAEADLTRAEAVGGDEDADAIARGARGRRSSSSASSGSGGEEGEAIVERREGARRAAEAKGAKTPAGKLCARRVGGDDVRETRIVRWDVWDDDGGAAAESTASPPSFLPASIRPAAPASTTGRPVGGLRRPTGIERRVCINNNPQCTAD